MKLVVAGDLKVFLILSLINMVGFLISFVQLLISKPKSKLVLIPIVLFTVTTFAILIALDFYLEIQLTHMTPKEIYTRSKTDPGKKSKSRLKMGYLVIYGKEINNPLTKALKAFNFLVVCLCFIAGFVYLAFKDFEEYLEAERMANEPNEIIISHIT